MAEKIHEIKECQPTANFFKKCAGQAGTLAEFKELTGRDACFCFQYFINDKLQGIAIVEFFLADKYSIVNVYVGKNSMQFAGFFETKSKELGCNKIRVHRHRDLKQDGRWCEVERVYEKVIL